MTSRPRSVAVVGVNYWPEVTGVGVYTTGLAEYLVRRAWHVEVFTGIPHYPAWQPEAGHRRPRSVSTHNGVEITRLWHTVPRPGSIPRRALWEATFLAGATVFGRPATKPDVVVGVVPNLSGGLAASRLAHRLRRPFVLIVQDLVSSGITQSGLGREGRVVRAVRSAEQHLYRSASLVIAVSEAFVAPIIAAGASPGAVTVARNWSSLDVPELDRGAARSHFGWGDDIVVLHTGTMAAKQGLDQAVEAARRTVPGSKLRWVLMGDGAEGERISALGAGVPAFDLLPPQTPGMHAAALAAADVLLVTQRPSVTDMCMPSKLGAYFAAGRPILGAVSADGATALELGRSGAAVVVTAGQPDELARAAEKLAASPSERTLLGAAGLAWAVGYEPERCLVDLEQMLIQAAGHTNDATVR